MITRSTRIAWFKDVAATVSILVVVSGVEQSAIISESAKGLMYAREGE
jgi:hypothetical protein